MQPVERLDRHEAEFQTLVGQAQHELHRGRHQAAATWAQIAANYAWLNHTGRFASPELEQLLAELSRAASRPGAAVARLAAGPPVHVLHVATQAYGTGGHTQMLSRWIAQDQPRQHRVLLTRQGSTAFPRKLTEKLATGDGLASLDSRPGGLIQRARRLRSAALRADLVLLHVHPYDVVPNLAFGVPDGLPPIVLVNHSDHAFWIGTAVTGVLLNLRDSGRELAIARRGIAAERAAVMSRPLGLLTERTISREQAKARFGVAADEVLIVTAAAGTKYQPISGPSLLELITPVLQAHPAAVLLAAGPQPSGQWAEAERVTGGRVRALGRLPDVTELHQAADAYLDSFPFASLTSMIESGSFANPLLTYRGHPAECAVLGADTRGLDEYLLRPTNPDELAADLSRLITDRQWRLELGEQTRKAIEATHLGDGWRSQVEQLYRLAASVPAVPVPGPAARGTGPIDQLVDLVQSQTGFSDGRPGVEREQLGLLPMAERYRCWRRLRAAGTGPGLQGLAPEWLLPQLSRLRRRGRSSS